MSLIKKYYDYSKERFPIVPALLYSGSLYYLSYFFPSLLPSSEPPQIFSSILGWIVLFFTILHLRIFDEHKDYKKDKIAHPDRMLSRGIITLQDLRKLLFVVLFLEALISIYLGIELFFIWLLILLWSILMFFEFFAPEFLNRRIVLYLISHQIIVPIICLFGFLQRIKLLEIFNANLIYIFIFFIGVMCNTITYEIARKTWSKDREHEHADSYTKFWGTFPAVVINQIISGLTTTSFLYIYIKNNLSLTYSIVLIGIWLVFLIVEIMFLMDPVKKKSKMVEIAGALFTIVVFINSAVGFAFI
ncbi:MAG: hypothetical protein HQK79_03110 [Desulfobacterales bacterium]|nr:hypothetical protein [Desulfobacterales bacterium]